MKDGYSDIVAFTGGFFSSLIAFRIDAAIWGCFAFAMVRMCFTSFTSVLVASAHRTDKQSTGGYSTSLQAM